MSLLPPEWIPTNWEFFDPNDEERLFDYWDTYNTTLMSLFREPGVLLRLQNGETVLVGDAHHKWEGFRDFSIEDIVAYRDCREIFKSLASKPTRRLVE